MLKKIILLTLFISSLVSTNVMAKWWIFGKSEANVATRYLYLNDVAFNELDEQVTLYRDMLPAGQVVLRGKASSGKSSIGKIEVSLDNKETWQKADKSEDGSFEFSFVPEIDRTYQLYVKILNTSGTSNEVDATYREITVSDSDIDTIIRQALDSMIQAYQVEEPRNFMTWIDDDFAGDYVLLDRAIRKDFTAFDALSLNYTLNSVVSGRNGKVFVTFTFNRQVTSSRSGETFVDQGLTEFIFNVTTAKAKVVAMKNPLIFGLSDAESVATGTVNSDENDENLAVDDDGDLRLGPADGDDDSGSFAAPVNLSVLSYGPYPLLTLQFDAPVYVNAASYRLVVEWSRSTSGPWVLDDEPLMPDPFSGQFGLHARPEVNDPSTIYYRVALERISDNQRSSWSDLVSIP